MLYSWNPYEVSDTRGKINDVMSRSTFIVVIKSWNEIMCTMSRTTDWATFLQDFSTASKVLCLYFTVEKVTLLNGNYQLALCYWLFSQVDVKLKQVFNGTRSDSRQFWTNKWRWNCIWQKKHSGFQINFQKIHSLLLFCLCSFIPLGALANRQEVNNLVAREVRS